MAKRESLQGPYYLVEDKRLGEITKYSGTLNFSARSDKHSATIAAFTHFAYEGMQKAAVFCDIQG